MSANGVLPSIVGVPPLTELSLRDLDVMAFPAVEWVVDGLIPAGALVLMVGRPKAGKSLLAIDMMASVALGDTFLDRATAQGPAVYVPAEDALSLVRDRMWNRLGAERDAPFSVVPVDGSLPQSLRIDEMESFMELANVVVNRKPVLVVLDPMRELHRRKENDADEMAELLRPLRQLAHETNTTILLIHHRNKYAVDPSLASRGSSAITGSVDLIISLELSGEDRDDDEMTSNRTMTLTTEGRYGPRKRVQAQLQSGLRWQPTKTRMDDLTTPQRIWQYLDKSGQIATADDIATTVGVPKGSAQNSLTELVKVGHISRLGAGSKADPYRYAIKRVPTDSSQPNTPPRENRDESAESSVLKPDYSSQHSSQGILAVTNVVYECASCGGVRNPDATQCPACGTKAYVKRVLR